MFVASDLAAIVDRHPATVPTPPSTTSEIASLTRDRVRDWSAARTSRPRTKRTTTVVDGRPGRGTTRAAARSSMREEIARASSPMAAEQALHGRTRAALGDRRPRWLERGRRAPRRRRVQPREEIPYGSDDSLWHRRFGAALVEELTQMPANAEAASRT